MITITELKDKLVKDLLKNNKVENVHAVGIYTRGKNEIGIEINISTIDVLDDIREYLENIDTGDFPVNIETKPQATTY